MTDTQAIQSTIQLYIDGIHTGDSTILRKAFHPQAMMYGSSPNNITIVGIEGLYGFVDANDPPTKTGDRHHCAIVAIRQNGNAAAVEMTEESVFGHNYTNYFQLLKIDGKWLIVSKSYNAAVADK